jgi:hypothetical protein
MFAKSSGFRHEDWVACLATLVTLALYIASVMLWADWLFIGALAVGVLAFLASGHFTADAKSGVGIVAGLCLTLVTLGALFMILLYPSIKTVREASANHELEEAMKKIGLAMHAYHDKHHHLPPQATSSKEGKRLLSWRVALLPFLGHDELYQQFKLDEPWDSPHNLPLAAKMPKAYAVPFFFEDNEPPNATYFQVFVGPGAAFEGKEGKTMPHDFPDGTSNTILMALADEPVLWTKPADLMFTPKVPMPKLRSGMWSSYPVVFGDSSWSRIPATITDNELRGLITRNGGEPAPKWRYE